MTTKTEKKIEKLTNIAYHELALGLYRGYIKSRCRPVENEVREYLNIRARTDRAWSNILKTKEQKELAVGKMSDMVIREFGRYNSEYAVQDMLPGFER